MKNFFITCIILLSMIQNSFETTCHASNGKRLCNPRKCPKKLNCQGNVGKDACGCCTVCLRQEGELCQLNSNDNAKCEHSAPHCARLQPGALPVCISLKTAIENNLPRFTRKLRKCRESKQYKSMMKTNPLHCFMKRELPAYFCRRYPRYLDDDCCLHSNGCNPHKKLYYRVNVQI